MAVRSIADDVTRWMTAGPSNRPPLQPQTLVRAGSKSSDIYVSYTTAASMDFARAVAARLRLERPTLKLTMESEDERKERAVNMTRKGDLGISPACSFSRVLLVTLTADTFSCPVVCQEIVACLEGEDSSVATGKSSQRMAFIYHVRSGKGQDPQELLAHAPLRLRDLLQKLSNARGVAAQPSPKSPRTSTALPIFEYLHEYDDLCVNGVLQWLDGLPAGSSSLPSPSTLARLHNAVRNVAKILSAPRESQSKQMVIPSTDKKTTLPPIRGSSSATSNAALSLGVSASAVKSSVRNLRPVALAMLHTACDLGKDIATEVSQACSRTFGNAVRTASISDESAGASLDSVANLLVIVTPGAFGPGVVLQNLLRAIRGGPVNILLLQDVCSVPNIWHEFGKLPAEVRPSICSIIALPYLKSHGFSACLARLAGGDLLQSVEGNNDKLVKPVCLQYGRSSSSKLFDLFFCHFQRTGLDWAFVMRLSFLQHAGPGFRTLLDVQSLQNLGESGRYVQQSHGMAVLVTPGIFTRFFCQRELMQAHKNGVQIIFIQHMRSCIDIEEELAKVSTESDVFMAVYGDEYVRAGGSSKDYIQFQTVLFQEIWARHFRPPVFAYIHELEAACVREVVAYLRHRRKRGTQGAEQLDDSARAILDFLRIAPEDGLEVKAGLSVLANQAAAGAGEEFSAALVRTKALPAIVDSLKRHGDRNHGVAHQALRALRSISSTSAGSTALAQFARTDGAIETLLDMVQKHTAETLDEESRDSEQGKLRREGLEVLRAFRNASGDVLVALQQLNLAPELERLFRRLRSELEPLDEIRETLELAPVRLPELEVALKSWHSAKASYQHGLHSDDTVARATLLTEIVQELREAVAANNGEQSERLLRDHVKEIERCADIEELLKEARRAAAQFQEQRRIREELCRTDEARLQARQEIAQKLEETYNQMLVSPAPALLSDLEHAIVSAHQVGCPTRLLEKSQCLLENVRAAFNDPLKFLSKPVLVCSANPMALARALFQANRNNRAVILAFLAAMVDVVTHQTDLSAKRSDVDEILYTLEHCAGDMELQGAACNCLFSFLHITRTRFKAYAARACVEDLVTGQIRTVQPLLSLVVTATDMLHQHPNGHPASCIAAACECLLETVMLGERAVADMMTHHGRSSLWHVVKVLGPENRLNNQHLVETIIQVFEEMGRHGAFDASRLAREALLNMCDFYGREMHVCRAVLTSLRTLYSETQNLAFELMDAPDPCQGTEPASPKSPHSPSWVRSCGLGIVLRIMDMHSMSADLLEQAFQILEMSLHAIDHTRGTLSEIDDEMCSLTVKLIMASLEVHLTHQGTCTAAASCLATALDASSKRICKYIMQTGGIGPLVHMMNAHPSALTLQQSSLKVLSITTRYFPRQSLDKASISAVLTAMQAGLDDALTQVFGCAALRSLAEQSVDGAKQVGHQASHAFFSAMDAFPKDLALHREALHAMMLVASADRSVARLLGERHQAVPKILTAIPSLLRSAAASTSPASSPKLPKQRVSRSFSKCKPPDESARPYNAVVMACRALRAICAGRAASGPSYELLFHRGVCDATSTLATLLNGAVPAAEAHELELETVSLLHDAAASDIDGARAVGRVLATAARPAMASTGKTSAGTPFNMVLDVLHRFHTDSDCQVIFGFIAELTASNEFVTSTASSSSVMEMLRLAAVHSSDSAVQLAAMQAFVGLLSSTALDASFFSTTDGVESFLLAAARVGSTPELVAMAHRAMLLLSKRSNSRNFYFALGAALKRQESNGAFMVAACQALSSAFEDDVVSCADLVGSGSMARLLSGLWKHKQHQDVRYVLPKLCELSIQRGTEDMRELLVKSHIVPLLHNCVELLSSDPAHQACRPAAAPSFQIWLFDVTLSSRRGTVKNLQKPASLGAAFSALARLSRSASCWNVVACPELVPPLFRAMASSFETSLLEPAAELLAEILCRAESHVTWNACIDRHVSDELLNLQSQSKLAIDNELLGFTQWSKGNFTAATRAFSSAANAYMQISGQLPEAHTRAAALAGHIKVCKQHFSLMTTWTATACGNKEILLKSKNEDCPICLESLHGSQELLWTCNKCSNSVHERCMERWCQNKSSCPMCRQNLGARDNGAYFRAFAIAESAESNLQQSTVDRPEFLCAAVASLWRSAMRLGTSLGVNSVRLANVDSRARQLEARSSKSIAAAFGAAKAFASKIVQPLQEKVARLDSDNLQAAAAIIEALAVEVAQRRCAALAEQVAMWHSDMSKCVDLTRLQHALELLQLMGCTMAEIRNLAPTARLNPADTDMEIDRLNEFREQLQASLSSSTDLSVGVVETRRVEKKALLPFNACLEGMREKSKSMAAMHGLEALRAITSTTRAIRSMPEGEGRAAELARRTASACNMIVDAILEDGLISRLSWCFTGDLGRPQAFLAASIFQDMLYCGDKAKQACFSQIDRIVSAAGSIASRVSQGDAELQSFLCDLVHKLIFSGGCADRMVRRLQREAAPRQSAVLEEWFLDTVLVQNGAVMLREEILQPKSEVDIAILGIGIGLAARY